MFIHVFVSLWIIQFIFSICTSTNLNLIDNFIFTFRCNHVTIWCPLYKPFSRLLWMVIIWRTYFLKWCMHIYPRIKTFANKRFRLLRGSKSSYICKKKNVFAILFFPWLSMNYNHFIEYILPHSSLRLCAELFLFYVYNIYFSTLTFLMRSFAYMTFTTKLTLNFAWNILSLDIIFFSMRMDMTCELCESSVITQILYI